MMRSPETALFWTSELLCLVKECWGVRRGPGVATRRKEFPLILRKIGRERAASSLGEEGNTHSNHELVNVCTRISLIVQSF